MRVGRIIWVLFFIFCFSWDAFAQWDPQISQYWRVKTSFNPSFAAESDTLQASILHRMQWVGMPGAPKTSIVSADMPLDFLGRRHGVGIVMMTEKLGDFSNTTVSAQYVYKKKWKKNMINIGLQAGYASVGFDASKIESIETEQELEYALPTGNTRSATFDAGLGVSWLGPNYYVGLSVTHLLQPSYDVSEELVVDATRTYYFTGGYNIRFRNPLFQLQPSTLIKTDGTLVQYDVTARVIYNNIFNGGLSWRKDDGFVFLLGLNVFGFDAGYAYDLSTSAISKASSGTHEFFLRYTIPMKKKKNGQYRHKSIRIL